LPLQNVQSRSTLITSQKEPKFLPPDIVSRAQNIPKCICCWSLGPTALLGPLVGFKGPLRGRQEGREEKKEGEENGRGGGKGRADFAPLQNFMRVSMP